MELFSTAIPITVNGIRYFVLVSISKAPRFVPFREPVSRDSPRVWLFSPPPIIFKDFLFFFQTQRKPIPVSANATSNFNSWFFPAKIDGGNENSRFGFGFASPLLFLFSNERLKLKIWRIIDEIWRRGEGRFYIDHVSAIRNWKF